jgi:hypothetical protein
LVRDYVERRAGKKYLNTLIAFGDSVDLLDRAHLPANFALKSNNGSGGMILVWDKAERDCKLPNKKEHTSWNKYLVQPANFDIEKAKSLAKNWLSSNYFFRPGNFPEWAYKDIKPMLLIEELMTDDQCQLPSDFKFFMANGECLFIQVDTSRFEGHRRDPYTKSWAKISGSYQHPESGKAMMKPRHLDEMLSVAKSLSKGVDFIRVDLYETTKGVKFGELTNYPGGGIERFNPQSLDFELGKNWVQRY